MDDSMGSWKPLSQEEEIDRLLQDKQKQQQKQTKKLPRYSAEERVKIANEIKTDPPNMGYMNVDVKPAVYSIDLNTDANWWFNHVCTVFPWLMDQGIRTHVDIRDSFKPEKRHADFNLVWLLLIPIGLAGLFFALSMFGVI